jgi:hypothetical protein
MPAWFEALSTDFRYQLTVIGWADANRIQVEDMAPRDQGHYVHSGTKGNRASQNA